MMPVPCVDLIELFGRAGKWADYFLIVFLGHLFTFSLFMHYLIF